MTLATKRPQRAREAAAGGTLQSARGIRLPSRRRMPLRLTARTPVTATATTAWTLADHVATQTCAGVAATLDLDHPRHGVTVAAGSLCDHLLGIALSGSVTAVTHADERPTEHWLRGTDVTAIYEPADPRRLRATAMWRPFPAPDAAAWELVASAQTSLLASDASLAVVSDLAAAEVLCNADPTAAGGWHRLDATVACGRETTAVLARRPAPDGARATSVLLAVHPADARTIAVTRREGRVGVACWLFSATLEKGVLLRGRVLAAVGPATGDLAWSARLTGQFAASAAPLST